MLYRERILCMYVLRKNDFLLFERVYKINIYVKLIILNFLKVK